MGAAATDVVESTTKVARYTDPNTRNPFLWYDVPGAGTLAFPDWQYFNDMGLFVFDAIIVLFDNRFTDTDVAILRNCARFNIPAYVVRSKAEVHINNIVKKKLTEWCQSTSNKLETSVFVLHISTSGSQAVSYIESLEQCGKDWPAAVEVDFVFRMQVYAVMLAARYGERAVKMPMHILYQDKATFFVALDWLMSLKYSRTERATPEEMQRQVQAS